MMNSDFLIDSRKYKRQKPLVLQNGFQKPFWYFNREWDTAIKVPSYDEKAIEERKLPGTNKKYPFLTVSDFLEPVLIEVPYSIDKDNFFTGEFEGFFEGDRITKDDPDNMYLLPIKPLYFDFFDLKDLMSKSSQVKPTTKFIKVGIDAVRVELLIPIQKDESIKFERIYDTTGVVDLRNNKGIIRKCKFSLGFLPFFEDIEMVEQRIGLVDADVLTGNKVSQYEINFLKNTPIGFSVIYPEHQTIRSDESKCHDRAGTTKYFLLNKPYNIIQVVKGQGIKGIIAPKFQKTKSGNKQFTFAIDFRPQFTHVEYAINKGLAKASLYKLTQEIAESSD